MKNEKAISRNEERLLIESAEIASSKAVRSSIALGLTLKFIEDNSIVEVNSKGKRIVRQTVKNDKIDLSKLKKGIVLERK
ncbi:MAG: hypothetical protein PHC64_10330 [Candidatus Gastranaerophilales bacterium]|nr:hypothetical protein [Candidatus Gastranaerophilales bacterium]